MGDRGRQVSSTARQAGEVGPTRRWQQPQIEQRLQQGGSKWQQTASLRVWQRSCTWFSKREDVFGSLQALAAALVQALLAAHYAPQVGGCGRPTAGHSTQLVLHTPQAQILTVQATGKGWQVKTQALHLRAAHRSRQPPSPPSPPTPHPHHALDVTSLHALRPSAVLVVDPAARLSAGAGVMVQSVSGPRAPFTRSHTSSTLHTQQGGHTSTATVRARPAACRAAMEQDTVAQLSTRPSITACANRPSTIKTTQHACCHPSRPSHEALHQLACGALAAPLDCHRSKTCLPPCRWGWW